MTDNSYWSGLLAKEAELLAKMVALEEETTPLLLEGTIEALQEMNFSKEKLVIEMQELERQRQEIFPRGVTLKEYIAKENPDNARELETLRTRLWRLQASLQRRQRINNNLLQGNLSFVEHALSVFLPAGEEQLYAAGGKAQEKERDSFPAALLDDQA